jgi:hypothetical protein
MTVSKSKRWSGVEIGRDGTLFFVHDGVRVAYRGQPNTPQAKTWVSLEPGFNVYGGPNDDEIVVEYKPASAQ